MGYSLQYSSDLNKEYAVPHKKVLSNKQKIILGVICVFMLLLMIPGVRDLAVNILIPGDSEVTASAFSNMICQVREGESIGKAVHAFCETVIGNG